MAKRHRGQKAKHIKSKFSYYIQTYLGILALMLLAGLIYFHSQGGKTYILTCIHEKTCKTELSLHIDNNVPGYFEGQKIIPPIINLQTLNNISNQSVLGIATPSGTKHIYVDLSTQTLEAFQGNSLILKTFVSTGKWDPTPIGNFYIWEKLLSTRMAGGQGADAYDLPNVPYVMYFYEGYGLHGAYWHDNFGHPMSHGCVNLRQIDARTLYNWADGPNGNKPGTEVSICNRMTSNNVCVQNNPIQ